MDLCPSDIPLYGSIPITFAVPPICSDVINCSQLTVEISGKYIKSTVKAYPASKDGYFFFTAPGSPNVATSVVEVFHKSTLMGRSRLNYIRDEVVNFFDDVINTIHTQKYIAEEDLSCRIKSLSITYEAIEEKFLLLAQLLTLYFTPVKGNRSETPIHVLCRFGFEKVLDYLMSNSAVYHYLCVEDRDGKTPADILIEKGITPETFGIDNDYDTDIYSKSWNFYKLPSSDRSEVNLSSSFGSEQLAKLRTSHSAIIKQLPSERAVETSYSFSKLRSSSRLYKPVRHRSVNKFSPNLNSDSVQPKVSHHPPKMSMHKIKTKRTSTLTDIKNANLSRSCPKLAPDEDFLHLDSEISGSHEDRLLTSLSSPGRYSGSMIASVDSSHLNPSLSDDYIHSHERTLSLPEQNHIIHGYVKSDLKTVDESLDDDFSVKPMSKKFKSEGALNVQESYDSDVNSMDHNEYNNFDAPNAGSGKNRKSYSLMHGLSLNFGKSKRKHKFSSASNDDMELQSTYVCVACSKRIMQKSQFLRCENCLATVHNDEQCISTVETQCNKAKKSKSSFHIPHWLIGDRVRAYSLPSSAETSFVKMSLSKATSSALFPRKPAKNPSIESLPRTTLPSAIDEEAGKDENVSILDHLLPHRPSKSLDSLLKSTSTPNLSISTESIGSHDEADSMEFCYQEDPIFESEKPIETWQEFVDDDLLKSCKNDTKLIKQQENMYELIRTERKFLRVLKIIDCVYVYNIQTLNIFGFDKVKGEDYIQKMFPKYKDLMNLAHEFVEVLNNALSSNKFIVIADIIRKHFSGENAEVYKNAFLSFCLQQEASRETYQSLCTLSKFEKFAWKCKSSDLCMRLDVPGLILHIVQRLTKYPVLIAAMVKYTNEKDKQYKSLTEALRLAKQIAEEVNVAVSKDQLARDLENIYARCDVKPYSYRSQSSSSNWPKKYKNTENKSTLITSFNKDFLINKSRALLYSAHVEISLVRQKPIPVLLLVMTDTVIILEEKDSGKLSIFDYEGKRPAINKADLEFKSKAGERLGFFLIDKANPEIYEMSASSKPEFNDLYQLISKEEINQDIIKQLKEDVEEKPVEPVTSIQITDDDPPPSYWRDSITQLTKDLEENEIAMEKMAEKKLNIMSRLKNVLEMAKRNEKMTYDPQQLKEVSETLQKSIINLTTLRRTSIIRSSSAVTQSPVKVHQLKKKFRTFSAYDLDGRENELNEFSSALDFALLNHMDDVLVIDENNDEFDNASLKKHLIEANVTIRDLCSKLLIANSEMMSCRKYIEKNDLEMREMEEKFREAKDEYCAKLNLVSELEEELNIYKNQIKSPNVTVNDISRSNTCPTNIPELRMRHRDPSALDGFKQEFPNKLETKVKTKSVSRKESVGLGNTSKVTTFHSGPQYSPKNKNVIYF